MEDLSKAIESKVALDADELLASEKEEIEGGAECGCTSCQYICYSSLW